MIKKKFHHGNLKEACITTGLEIIKDKGIENLSLREVARQLDVSHGAPYKHFPTKDDLVAAISEKGFELFGKILRKAISGDISAYEKFSNAGHAWLSFVLENPDYYRLLTGNYLPDISRHPAVLLKAMETYQFMNEVLDEFNKKGLIQIEDLFVTTIFMISNIHGFCSLVVENRFQFLGLSNEQYHSQLENVLELCWKSFLP